MLLLYFFLIVNYVLLSRLYSNRKVDDNDVKILVLSFLVIVFAFHSILILFEFFSGYNIGLKSFWRRDSNIPKSSYGYIFGAIFGLLYISAFVFLKKKIAFRKKIRIIRKILTVDNIKPIAVFYLSMIIFMSITTFFLVILM